MAVEDKAQINHQSPWDEEKLGFDTHPYLSEGATQIEADRTYTSIRAIYNYVTREVHRAPYSPNRYTCDMPYYDHSGNKKGRIRLRCVSDGVEENPPTEYHLEIKFMKDGDGMVNNTGQIIRIDLTRQLDSLKLPDDEDRFVVRAFQLAKREGSDDEFPHFSMPFDSQPRKDGFYHSRSEGIWANTLVKPPLDAAQYGSLAALPWSLKASDRGIVKQFEQNFPRADKRACLRAGLDMAVEAIKKT